jgi:hypothetical protein
MMRVAFAAFFVANLLLATLASAAVEGSKDAAAAPTANAASPHGEVSPVPGAVTTQAALVPAAPRLPATPSAEWLYACVPQCSYYYGICQEECSGRGGIKSFTCTPPPPGTCAHFTCTCNKGL